MKYKKGDKVRVKSREYFNGIGAYCVLDGCVCDPNNEDELGFHHAMLEYCGKEYTITDIRYGYYILSNNDMWHFANWMLEDVSFDNSIIKHQVMRRRFSKISSTIY